MSDLEHNLEQWLTGNEAHLSASLSWLRLRFTRLVQHAENGGNAPLGSATSEPAKAPWWKFESGKPAREAILPALLKEDPDQLQKRVSQAAQAAVAAAETMDPPPALSMLAQRFGLSHFEQQVLLLCSAMELDPHTASLCAYVHGDPAKTFPTFALALSLFENPSWDALSPQRPLRYWKFLEIHQPGALPLTASALRLDERMLNLVKGLNHLDDRLALYLQPLEGSEAELPPSQQASVDRILNHVGPSGSASSSKSSPSLVQLPGPHGPSKQQVAARVAATLGLHLHRLPVEAIPAQPGDLDTFLRLWQRELRLLPVGLYVDANGTGGTGGANLAAFLQQDLGLCFVDTRESLQVPGSAVVEVAKPSHAEQRAAWSQALGDRAGESPTLLGGQFNLGLQDIRNIVSGVTADASGTLHEKLWDACIQANRPQLDALAQRLHPIATWEDLILPANELGLLRQIAGQVSQRMAVFEEGGFGERMNRGFGISALFAGESGTGKTMAAEVIANALRLNLYRIDLSAVVSKYIGETEKNLRKLFDAAEDGGAILFFDEADALFGKRSEVKDSHDRYANIEINYLLQRMESFQGLAILATNMKGSLDTAFMRRLRFVVNFPHPGAAERRQIWEKVFPSKTPTQALDFQRLARLNISGGNIHTIALNAAFLAASARKPVGMEHVLEAARAEFQKLERPMNEADFRVSVPVLAPVKGGA
ncbi:ATPase [Geothrix limicola]|uniref:ATPase n=1 Tax=Geothrix limicola TaxID=2927978 RepID=A0ABQ5QHU0_9BACT|nr:ATP-binding protein [Geothrix limicola]GLH74133.1 ATPase [Geothrix limicola]